MLRAYLLHRNDYNEVKHEKFKIFGIYAQLVSTVLE